jgi:hypothetical protein
VTTYITFGYDHANIHPAIGTDLHQGFLAIDLGDDLHESVARDVAVAIIGEQWAFSYPTPPGADRPDRPDWYRKGEIARVVLINEGRRQDIVRQIAHTHEMHNSGSSDDELESLQTARDMLAELIGYTHEED